MNCDTLYEVKQATQNRRASHNFTDTQNSQAHGGREERGLRGGGCGRGGGVRAEWEQSFSLRCWNVLEWTMVVVTQVWIYIMLLDLKLKKWHILYVFCHNFKNKGMNERIKIMERLERKKSKNIQNWMVTWLLQGASCSLWTEHLGGKCGMYSVAHRLGLQWASASCGCWTDAKAVLGDSYQGGIQETEACCSKKLHWLPTASLPGLGYGVLASISMGACSLLLVRIFYFLHSSGLSRILCSWYIFCF